MDNQYVAFLRAINVGGRNVKKDKLKQIFTELEFSNIDTYLASGNVIFETEIDNGGDLETMIEEKLQKELDFDVPTFVRTRDELDTLIENLPFESDKVDRDHTYVSFVKNELMEPEAEKLEQLKTEIDILQPDQRVIHWWYRRSKGDSTLTNGDMEKGINQLSTRRNTNTIKRIINKYYRD